MNRNLVYTLLVALIAMVSCQKDFRKEDYVKVTFNVTVPEMIGTKAIIGQDPVPSFEKQLTLAIYRTATGAYLPNVEYEIVKDFGTDTTAKVSAYLVKGQEYDFVFWADEKDSEYYTLNYEDRTVTVNYDKMKTNNNANTDAWFHVEKKLMITASSNIEDHRIVLIRPLAQINVGTKDFDSAVHAGVTVTESAVKIKGAARTLDLFTGNGLDPIDTEVELSRSPIPYSDNKMMLTVNLKYDENGNYIRDENGNIETDEYEYMSVCYILPYATQSTQEGYPRYTSLVEVEVKFFEDGNEAQINEIIRKSSVPVCRNHRTNLINDRVLTRDAEFNVEIEELFYGEYVDKDYDGDVDNGIIY